MGLTPAEVPMEGPLQSRLLNGVERPISRTDVDPGSLSTGPGSGTFLINPGTPGARDEEQR